MSKILASFVLAALLASTASAASHPGPLVQELGNGTAPNAFKFQLNIWDASGNYCTYLQRYWYGDLNTCYAGVDDIRCTTFTVMYDTVADLFSLVCYLSTNSGCTGSYVVYNDQRHICYTGDLTATRYWSLDIYAPLVSDSKFIAGEPLKRN